MTVDQLISAAREAGFSDLDSIRALARAAVALTPRPLEGEQTTSRLGGRPALPPSTPWPKREGRSLGFVCQIDLGSQPKAAAEQGYPREGLLLFFYDEEAGTWGFDPKDAGSFSVIYVQDPAQARVADWPSDLAKDARYEPCALISEEAIALPPWDSVLIEDLHLDEDQLDAYQELLEKLNGDDAWRSRGLLGGYPDQIQGDMSLECALVAAGLYCGESTAYEDPRLPTFREHARDWRLLLQIPSADPPGMMWGDAGCLYYWIREEDLKARRFDRSWMILQCG